MGLHKNTQREDILGRKKCIPTPPSRIINLLNKLPHQKKITVITQRGGKSPSKDSGVIPLSDFSASPEEKLQAEKYVEANLLKLVEKYNLRIGHILNAKNIGIDITMCSQNKTTERAKKLYILPHSKLFGIQDEDKHKYTPEKVEGVDLQQLTRDIIVEALTTSKFPHEESYFLKVLQWLQGVLWEDEEAEMIPKGRGEEYKRRVSREIFQVEAKINNPDIQLIHSIILCNILRAFDTDRRKMKEEGRINEKINIIRPENVIPEIDDDYETFSFLIKKVLNTHAENNPNGIYKKIFQGRISIALQSCGKEKNSADVELMYFIKSYIKLAHSISHLSIVNLPKDYIYSHTNYILKIITKGIFMEKRTEADNKVREAIQKNIEGEKNPIISAAIEYAIRGTINSAEEVDRIPERV